MKRKPPAKKKKKDRRREGFPNTRDIEEPKTSDFMTIHFVFDNPPPPPEKKKGT